MNPPLPILTAQNVTFSYTGEVNILHGLDINIAEKRLTCILGSNGCGKTTLLKCLLGNLNIASGSICINNRQLRNHTTNELAALVAYVPQVPTAEFSFSAFQIVLMGRYVHTGALGLSTADDIKIAQEAMHLTHTEHLENRTVSELSGGEAQRVMIARAVAQSPSILLLDEPTSQLDVRNQLAIYELMKKLTRERRVSIVCISHDINLAARYADSLFFMKDGHEIAHGPPCEVINKSILEEVYGVGIRLIETEDEVPFVQAVLSD